MAVPAQVRVVMAPTDCTQSAGLRAILTEARVALASGFRPVTIDLSGVTRMNARLLATILLVAREVRRAGGQLRLQGATEDFRKWARTFRILGALERGGVLPASDRTA